MAGGMKPSQKDYLAAAFFLVFTTAFLRLMYALRRFLCSALLCCLPISVFTLFAGCDFVWEHYEFLRKTIQCLFNTDADAGDGWHRLRTVSQEKGGTRR